MAKKQLKIPFKDGRPCKWVKDVHDPDAGRAPLGDHRGAWRGAGVDR